MAGDLEIYSDGGARGNPGPAACAFVIKSGGRVLASDSKYLGKTTNNFAEYQGVVFALNFLVEGSFEVPITSEIKFYLDSELVVRQLNGHYKVKNPALQKANEEVKNLLIKLSSKIVFENVPRVENKEADSLVNRELDRKHEA